jgi:hypothetical protein
VEGTAGDLRNADGTLNLARLTVDLQVCMQHQVSAVQQHMNDTGLVVSDQHSCRLRSHMHLKREEAPGLAPSPHLHV